MLSKMWVGVLYSQFLGLGFDALLVLGLHPGQLWSFLPPPVQVPMEAPAPFWRVRAAERRLPAGGRGFSSLSPRTSVGAREYPGPDDGKTDPFGVLCWPWLLFVGRNGAELSGYGAILESLVHVL